MLSPSRFTLLLLIFLALPVALGQRIHAGSETGSYTNDFCPQVERALRAEFFEHTCTTSQGSSENIERVQQNPHDVGIGQFDVVAEAADNNPNTFAFVNPGIGVECLYAVTREANIENLSGLSPRMPVALPGEQSGSTTTFRFLQTLDESLASMRNVSYYESAIEAVRAVVNGDAALAFFVQFPNTDNPVFQTINNNNLSFVPVVNRQILRREVGGQNVYQPQEVVVTPGGFFGFGSPTTVLTTCMPMVLFTGDPELFEEGSVERQDQVDLLAQLAETQAPTTGNWTNIFRNAVDVSQERIQSFLDGF